MPTINARGGRAFIEVERGGGKMHLLCLPKKASYRLG